MTVRRLIATSTLLLAAACGGSSSSKSTPPPPSGRTVTYSGPVTTAALSATTDKAAIAGMAASAAKGLSGMSSFTGVLGAAAPQRRATVKNALLLVADGRHQLGGASVAGALQEQSGPCDLAGTVTFRANDVDDDPATTQSGDYFEIVFAGCEDEFEINDGSMRITFTSTTGDDFVADASSITANVSFGMSLVTNGWVTVDKTTGSWDGIDGDLTVSFAADVAAGTLTYAISGRSLEAASGTGTEVAEASLITGLTAGSDWADTAVERYTGMGTANATVVEERWDLDARLCSTELSGCLNVETNPSFSLTPPALYPSAGALTVSDGADWIRVTAVSSSGTCNLTWSIDGQAGGPQATTWAELDSAANTP